MRRFYNEIIDLRFFYSIDRGGLVLADSLQTNINQFRRFGTTKCRHKWRQALTTTGCPAVLQFYLKAHAITNQYHSTSMYTKLILRTNSVFGMKQLWKGQNVLLLREFTWRSGFQFNLMQPTNGILLYVINYIS